MQSYFCFYLTVFLTISIYSQNITVNTNADGGSGNLRQAIININNGSDSSNTINLEIFNNAPIVLQSDLPVIKKNTVINSTGKQPIDGQGQYRLFATIMADLTINNCTLQNVEQLLEEMVVVEEWELGEVYILIEVKLLL